MGRVMRCGSVLTCKTEEVSVSLTDLKNMNLKALSDLYDVKICMDASHAEHSINNSSNRSESIAAEQETDHDYHCSELNGEELSTEEEVSTNEAMETSQRKCSKCDKVLSNGHQLRLHEKMHAHLDKRPNKICKVCNMSFTCVTYYNTHVRKNHASPSVESKVSSSALDDVLNAEDGELVCNDILDNRGEDSPNISKKSQSKVVKQLENLNYSTPIQNQTLNISTLEKGSNKNKAKNKRKQNKSSCRVGSTSTQKILVRKQIISKLKRPLVPRQYFNKSLLKSRSHLKRTLPSLLPDVVEIVDTDEETESKKHSNNKDALSSQPNKSNSILLGKRQETNLKSVLSFPLTNESPLVIIALRDPSSRKVCTNCKTVSENLNPSGMCPNCEDVDEYGRLVDHAKRTDNVSNLNWQGADLEQKSPTQPTGNIVGEVVEIVDSEEEAEAIGQSHNNDSLPSESNKSITSSSCNQSNVPLAKVSSFPTLIPVRLPDPCPKPLAVIRIMLNSYKEKVCVNCKTESENLNPSNICPNCDDTDEHGRLIIDMDRAERTEEVSNSNLQNVDQEQKFSESSNSATTSNGKQNVAIDNISTKETSMVTCSICNLKVKLNHANVTEGNISCAECLTKKLTCMYCMQKFSTANELKQHGREVHPVLTASENNTLGVRLLVTCHKCHQKARTDQVGVLVGKVTCEECLTKALTCGFCKEMFETMDALKLHRRQQHFCKICSKHYENMSKHKLKQVACILCHVLICKKYNIPKHYQNKHNKYWCQLCNFIFDTEYERYLHTLSEHKPK